MAAKKTTSPKKTKVSVKKPEVQKVAPVKMKLSTKKIGLIVLVLVILTALIYFAKSLIFAAFVNGQPITRLAVVNDLETHYGKQSLDTLVTQTLIFQEAKKKNISISDKEVNDEYNKLSDSLKSQGQDINQAMAQQGISKSDLMSQIKIQKIVEKLLSDKIQVSDSEINDYIKNNKDTFPKGQTDAQMKDTAANQIKQQKLSQEFQPWLDSVRKNAKIKYFVSY